MTSKVSALDVLIPLKYFKAIPEFRQMRTVKRPIGSRPKLISTEKLYVVVAIYLETIDV